MNKAKVAQYKKDEAARIKSLLHKYKVIAIADMTNMPSPQLQKLRSATKNSVFITMSKGRIIKIIFDDLKDKIKGIEKLKDCMRGMPALLLTNDNPFKLSKLLKKSKSSAPAKAGQVAPNDIVIYAGPTPFPPGPIIGELGQVGIKAAVVEGKVAVKEDKVVVKEGQIITAPVANVLTKLGIEPMEIGISLLAALEDGVVFKKDVLNVDEAQYIENVKAAYQNAFNLAFNIAYPTKINIRLLLQKAFRDSNALAESRDIFTSEKAKKDVGKAGLQAQKLKEKLNLPQEFFDKESGAKEEKRSEKVHDNKIKTDEEVAQSVLKKLQDEKIAKQGEIKKVDPKFKKEEKLAQDVLKKLQDAKIKKEEKKHK